VIATQTDTYASDRSLSVCKMYENLAGSDSYDANDFRSTSCQFTEDPKDDDEGDICDQEPEECDDEVGTRWHVMEGPEVNEERFDTATQDEVLDDYQTRITHSDCVLNGENVSEGTVANVASDSFSGYESGGDSPDWEVCLNINITTSDTPDVEDGFHTTDYAAHQFGGQWYDLDDDRVDYYLRPGNNDGRNGGENDYDGQGHLLISDATEDQREDPGYIAYYYRQNPNPYHPQWNPRGFIDTSSGNEYYYGTAIEDDCDQDLQGCDDSDVQTNFFYSFLWQNQGQTVDDLVRSDAYAP
jgi:hypothetical protein